LTGEIQPRYQADIGFRVTARSSSGRSMSGRRSERVFSSPGSTAAIPPGGEVAKAEVATGKPRRRRSEAQDGATRLAPQERQHHGGALRSALKTFKTAQAAARFGSRQARSQASENNARLQPETEGRPWDGSHNRGGRRCRASSSAPGRWCPSGQPSEREAVFNCRRGRLLKTRPGKTPTVEVNLVSSPDVRTEGRVRYISPQADPNDPHLNGARFAARCGRPQMRLRRQCRRRVTPGTRVRAITIPAAAVSKSRAAAVWLVEKEAQYS